MRATLLLMGLLALAACDRQKGEDQQGGPNASFETAAPAGAQVGIDRSRAGAPLPAVTFHDPEGEETSLDAFKGKPLLVNLWATWCAPCVKELPTLDALADQSGAPHVLALSQDMSAQAKVEAFLAEKKISLEPYHDPEMAMSTALGATILPTTILYGSDGREVWRYTGDLDWTGSEAAALLAEAR